MNSGWIVTGCGSVRNLNFDSKLNNGNRTVTEINYELGLVSKWDWMITGIGM